MYTYYTVPGLQQERLYYSNSYSRDGWLPDGHVPGSLQVGSA